MPAYAVVDVDVKDPVAYKEYREKAPATITAFGGRYLVRGPEPVHVEKGWDVARFVIAEFPSMEKAKAWYASPAYQRILPIRLKSTRSRLMFVQGLEPGAPLPA